MNRKIRFCLITLTVLAAITFIVGCGRNTTPISGSFSPETQPLPAGLHGGVDLVTACPPYVPDADLHLLARDVRAHEPLLALAGGADGLDVARRCVEAAARLLRPGGWLLIEIGGRQAGTIAAHMERHGLAAVHTGRDSDGYDRRVRARCVNTGV